ncbi:MAG TPA: methyltransferase domain-containing protein [Magnetospirillaceae bacterium]|jgi:tRNA (cmo5U34)-methyltransferase
MSISTAGVDRASVIAAKFDSSAATYDAARARLVPCFMRFYETVIALLPFSRDAAIDVLDLGAGTGLLAAWVAEAFPQAKMTLVDVAATMLERAKIRLASIAHTPTIVVSDYANAPLGGPYDAVVSALSIHHCDDDAKRALFKHVFAALRSGGVFVNAEQVAGPTPALDAEYERAWHADIRAAGASEEEIAVAEIRMHEDRCAPLDAQLAWLREAGFVDVDCRFKDGRFAVYSGRKAL